MGLMCIVQVLFAGFRTILLVNNLYLLPIFGVNLPASAFSCDIVLTILLHIVILEFLFYMLAITPIH